MRATHSGAAVLLREVLPEARWIGNANIRAAALATDPARVEPGAVFVALDSVAGDSHPAAAEAAQRGAAAVVAERLLPLDVPQGLVEDSRAAHALLCQALAGRPSERLQTIGVTGSHGKTTTSLLIAAVLEAAGLPSGVACDVGWSTSLAQTRPRRGLAEPAQWARWLAQTHAAGCGQAVLEVSSRTLAERRLAGVGLDVAVFTNLRREHAAWHGSLENYRRAKRRLLDQLKPGGLAVLNADDAACRDLFDLCSCPALTYGLHLEADVTATVLERHASEQTFLLVAGSDSAPVRTRMIGDQHVAHCLAAAAAGLALGIDLPLIARGLEAVEYVPGRLERIECGQPFSVFVDGGRSPDELALTLQAVRQACRGRVLCVFGCPGERDRAQRPLVGRVVERGASLAVITGASPRHESPLSIAHDILDGFAKPGAAHVLPSRGEAIRFALAQARPGDAVLLAGQGERTVQRIGSQRLAWNEAEFVRGLLRDLPGETALPHGWRVVG